MSALDIVRDVADLSRLDDQDYPAFTTGQAAELVGVQEAFLRSLDTADVVRPQRSAGGHRRYSRRQLTLVARLREQLDDGHTLAAAARIVGLQDQLADAENTITELRAQLGETDPDGS
ncbi:MerR family transcriptional regulator [Amycolatopsis sp.]|uniref:MerR family transcriptional regulator n=1 Tax=Amycolatopsis sp. TaxID=37632 RepID=UPI002BBF3798|nr:MerR family transcriptional regulator [Amycolatopsis sp.]HVV08410.1 MerR family transcriptional regulator [Amycolatopsis sp.]